MAVVADKPVTLAVILGTPTTEFTEPVACISGIPSLVSLVTSTLIC
jgi:hypothetical protein